MKRQAIINEEATKKIHERHNEKVRQYAVFNVTTWSLPFITKRSIYDR